MLECLGQQDLYLQPSYAEGLPRTLVDAMSRGVPALGPKIDGIQELLPGRWLHRAGDAEELSGQILEVAGSAELQEEMARENLRRAADYRHSILSERRATFWREFARFAAPEGRE